MARTASLELPSAAGFDAWWARIQISTATRADIYSTLALLLENNVLLTDALAEMYAVASDDGRHPKRPHAAMLYEVRQQVAEGKPFSEAMRSWVSDTEAAIIAAGERSGDMRGAFNDALRLLDTQKKIRGPLIGGSLYPLGLLVVLVILLMVVAVKLVPSLEAIAPHDTWTGSLRMLYLLSAAVMNYGVAIAVSSVLIVGGALYSLPRLRGDVRFRLDRLPPWSIYRLITGAMALENIAVLIKSGVQLRDALILLTQHANPYVRERIDAAIHGISKGYNLGAALEAAEFDWPDRETVKYLRLLASRDGFDRALTRFAREWIETCIKKVTAAMRVFLYAVMFGVGACAVLIILASTDIQNLVTNH